MRKLWVKLNKQIAKRGLTGKIRKAAFRNLGNVIEENVYFGEDSMLITETGYYPKVIIKERASISPRVTFVLASGSNNSRIRNKKPLIYGDIVIEKDAWIGTGVIIYPNVTIGECAIVASGSVVSKDVPPFTLVGGVPAKYIKEIEV